MKQMTETYLYLDGEYKYYIGDSTSLDIILPSPDDGLLEPKRYRVDWLSFTLNSSSMTLFINFL